MLRLGLARGVKGRIGDQQVPDVLLRNVVNLDGDFLALQQVHHLVAI